MKTLLVALVLLAGCQHFTPEPQYLEFPPEPHLTWALCDPSNETVKVCLSQADAQKLAKWIDKVRVFEHARDRLIK